MPSGSVPASPALPMPESRARAVLDAARGPAPLGPIDLARRAGALRVPVLVIAQAATARRRLARALHALGGGIGPLVILERPGDTVPPAATIFVDLDLVGADARSAVVDLVDDDVAWILIGVSSPDDLPAPVRDALGAVDVALPQLAAEEIATVARAALQDAGAAGAEPVLTPAARAWLGAQAALRDPDRLVRILRRAAVLAGPGTAIDVAHLATSGAPLELAPDESPSAAPVGAGARLEFVLAELAHELRNPLVTLQTVTEHLDELAQDPELRRRFAALGRDAVARMDEMLENLVTYGRLGPPVARATSVGAVLDEALRDAAPVLADRGLRVQADLGETACMADRQHLAFALKNLLVGVAHAADPGGALQVDARANGVVRLRFTPGGDGAALQAVLTAPGADALYDPAYQPLPFSLARAVLENLGGRFDMAPAPEGGTALEVHLPVAMTERS